MNKHVGGLDAYYRTCRELHAAVGPVPDMITGSVAAIERTYANVDPEGEGHHPDLEATMASMYLWAASGFQRVQASSDLWSSLAATAYDGVDPDEMKPPWTAFLLDLPDGLVPFVGRCGRPASIRYVIVSGYELPNQQLMPGLRWTWHGWSDCVSDPDNDAALYEVNYPSDVLLTTDDSLSGDQSDDWLPLESTDMDVRARHVVRRLICGICLAFANARTGESDDTFRLQPRPRKARDEQPASTITRVIGPNVVRLDGGMRQAVRNYVLHGRGALRTLHVVRGHFRMQACGERHSLRRRTWIAPHMRGPKDATMVIRPTILRSGMTEPVATDASESGNKRV